MSDEDEVLDPDSFPNPIPRDAKLYLWDYYIDPSLVSVNGLSRKGYQGFLYLIAGGERLWVYAPETGRVSIPQKWPKGFNWDNFKYLLLNGEVE